jgi:hypothetical protein
MQKSLMHQNIGVVMYIKHMEGLFTGAVNISRKLLMGPILQ